MVDLTGLLSHLGKCKVAVAGDLLLDAYTIGEATRISPEGPVPIINVQREEFVPGGAGNVLLNLVSLGADVVAIGRVGSDSAGERLLGILADEGVDTGGIIAQDGFMTPVKNRIIADNQQIARVDREQILPLSELSEEAIITALPRLLEGVSVLAISDYGKGFLSKTLLSVLIEEAKKMGITIVADPKGIDYSKYCGVDLLKPNLSEAYAAAKMESSAPLDLVAERLLAISGAAALMITRSKEGISLFYPGGESSQFPVVAREVKDVTGAGDTVLAMVTVVLANGLPLAVAALMSNLAASIAIQKVGCARVSLAQLAESLLADDSSNKVFDEEHTFALQQILQSANFSVVSLSENEGFGVEVYQAIKTLSMQNSNLLVYLRDPAPSEGYVSLLSSLKEVTYLIVKGDSLASIGKVTRPAEAYLFEDGRLQLVDHLSSLL